MAKTNSSGATLDPPNIKLWTAAMIANLGGTRLSANPGAALPVINPGDTFDPGRVS